MGTMETIGFPLLVGLTLWIISEAYRGYQAEQTKQQNQKTEKVEENEQEMKSHSDKLVEGSLKVWPNYFGSIFNLGSKYDDEKVSYVPNEIGSFSSVPYSDFLSEHIQTGYPELWSDWERLPKEANEFNSMEASLKEVIRKNVEEILSYI